jgi:hypothetical protein
MRDHRARRQHFAHDEAGPRASGLGAILAQHQLVQRIQFPWHHFQLLGFVAGQALFVQVFGQHSWISCVM